MNAPVEERLRRALAQQAETTATSPDAWRHIQARRAGNRRPAFVRWTVLAPAAALTVLILVVLAVAGDRGERTLRVTGDAGRLYLKPTGVEPRFRLVGAGNREGREPWSFRAFGRRGVDGVTLDASVVVAMPSVGILDSIVVTFLPTPLRAAGRDVTTATDQFSRRILNWTQADNRTVGVVTHGLSEGEVVSLAESLLAGDAATAAPVLPAGFTALDSAAVPGGTSVATQTWQADDGDSFMLSVAHEPGATLDRLAWSLPGGRVTRVRDTTALYRAGHTGYLGWIERPGTIVTLRGIGLTEQDLLSIAEGLRPIDDSEGREMIDRLGGSLGAGPPLGAVGPPPDIPPPAGAAPSPSAWLGFLPVRGRDAPPCRTIQELWLAEIRAGQEVACYKISGPALNAGDVASAVVRQDRTTATWTVELTLTDAGTARLAAFFRDVGAGGQYAVIVDGKLVSVPRFDTPPSATALITDLDEQTARSIAERLPR